ncbi:hypothetical protein NT6N_10240 [Oceaniferula spumae]|uniref:Verru_Chthon cassette protein A n=1 Tax=Oceaniferula spumae TaxID=2979115 RepID=A0AAT9FJ34_9BACT
MHISAHHSACRTSYQGFALVATITMMVLLSMIALAMISLSTLEVRQKNVSYHQEEAKANARMALMMALGELQKSAGPDQRVTAQAAILEPPEGTATVANRNWTGVWKTTVEEGNMDWPLIGKSTSAGSSPYDYQNIYSDLRETRNDLQNKSWRNELLESWLVSSRAASPVPSTALDPNDPAVVELVGEGTLGNNYSAAEFARNQVVVETIPVGNNRSSAYGWYISDSNQKASVNLNPEAAGDAKVPFLASQTDNPASVSDSSGATPYIGYIDSAKDDFPKIISFRSAPMTGNSEAGRKTLAAAMGSHFHHLTTDASGLFVDTALGGLKKDLEPLMFGKTSQEVISMTSPSAAVSPYSFSSDDPIIPGSRHGVLGPSFGAIRYWGRMKSLSGLNVGVIDAQVSHKSGSSTRVRPTTNWPHGVSDGQTFDGGKWASSAPKVHPIMTDCRWHYYFSHTDDTTKQSLRTHLIPRVCLWNPYSVSMKTEELVVLMPNPYWRYTNAFHFQFSAAEAQRMKTKYPQPNGPIDRWGADGNHKIRARGSSTGGKDGLFPDTRYLGFVLERSTLGPGECLVFSPLIKNADETSQGLAIQRYNKDNVAANVLSASVPQGEDHFFHDYESNWIELQTENAAGNNSWLNVPSDVFREMRLSEVYRYEPWGVFHDNFPFVLKGVNGSISTSVANITSSSAASFPTLQLINNGNGGVSTYDFWNYEYWWGNSDTASSGQFGDLTSFDETPRKNAPALHQIGAKLMWLDETGNEANSPPLRVNRWSSNHMVFNPAPVANWNVRPGLATRSPASPCSAEWYVTSLGAWFLQFVPNAPQDANDIPSLSPAGKFSKSPFGPALNFSSAPDAIMFDLPDPDFGALSLGSLRHAQLSPYSWHPTYIVGHSLADIHAPFETSAHMQLASSYSGSEKSSWDEAIGGTSPYPLTYGPRTWSVNSTGLLQIGNLPTTKSVGGTTLSSSDEILAYDIAFEVNQNLWDQFFLSGMPMNDSGSAFTWTPGNNDRLWNERHQWNRVAKIDTAKLTEQLGSGTGDPLGFAFWNNAYILKNKGAFNVNSTSVQAWTAFLSGLQGMDRPLQHGNANGGMNSIFSRIQKPKSASTTGGVAADSAGGWGGARALTEDEIGILAGEIVKEVKTRGPFVSLADFVNRRLAPKADPTSMMGTLEAAIQRTGLNKGFEEAPYLPTTNNANDNNKAEWKVDLDKQPKSKAWGAPGYITQGDLLEPLAPAMTVRGDTFIIRCYGESRNSKGAVVAKAYLEATVERSPDYIASASVTGGTSPADANMATEPAMVLDRVTGAVTQGNLTDQNRRFGRKFVIKSFRWLAPDEV